MRQQDHHHWRRLVIVTNDERLAQRLALLHNLGFTTPRFRREVFGYNFRMTGYQATTGVVPLNKVERIFEEKRTFLCPMKQQPCLQEIPGFIA